MVSVFRPSPVCHCVDDLPTLARRTASVCPAGVRPRVPQCAGARSGRSSWIPAHRPSCRRDAFDSQLFQTLTPLIMTFLKPFCSLLLWQIKKNSVTGDLLAHMCRSAGGPFRLFAIPDSSVRGGVPGSFSPPPASNFPLVSYTSVQFLQQEPRSVWEEFSVVRSESLERPDWEGGRWDDL